VSGQDAELALVSLAAMLSPTTLTFCVLALVLAKRPLLTGFWFYLGALAATLAVGVAAAFVLGDAAASGSSTPKTWVAVLDVVFGALLIVYAARLARRPLDRAKQDRAIARMRDVASSRAVAIFGAGATLANPGAFIPIALKDISEQDPTATQYAVWWTAFAVLSLLPLGLALVALGIAPGRTRKVLDGARDWLERRAQTVAAVIVAALGIVLLRNGISGLTA
jgi:uncharacterized membrane protein